MLSLSRSFVFGYRQFSEFCFSTTVLTVFLKPGATGGGPRSTGFLLQGAGGNLGQDLPAFELKIIAEFVL